MTIAAGYSKTTHVVCTGNCLIWGSMYLGRAVGWALAEKHHLPIQVASVLACGVSFGVDWLRGHLPRTPG